MEEFQILFSFIQVVSFYILAMSVHVNSEKPSLFFLLYNSIETGLGRASLTSLFIANFLRLCLVLEGIKKKKNC